MPELPEVELYLHALAPRIVGRPLVAARVKSPFLVPSTDPRILTGIGNRKAGPDCRSDSWTPGRARAAVHRPRAGATFRRWEGPFRPLRPMQSSDRRTPCGTV